MPISSRLVAADSIWNCAASPAFSTKSFITNSAIGLRQIFPWQTNRIFFISWCLPTIIFALSIANEALSVERKYVRRTPFLDRISGKRSPFERSSLFQALKGGVHSKSGAYLIYSTFVRNSKELFIQSVYGFSAFLNLIESNTSVFPVHHIIS